MPYLMPYFAAVTVRSDTKVAPVKKPAEAGFWEL